MKNHIKKLYDRLIRLLYQFIYWAVSTVPLFNLYQPIFGSKVQRELTRQCEDRWMVFSKYLPTKKGSVLDIGCNIGYFSFKCTEQGHFAYGIEADDFNITCCNAIKSVTKTKNCVFVKQLIDTDFIDQMPAFDTIINLSVFHHWVKVYGFDTAKKMMQQLANKCSCLIFETGQSTETGSQWPEILSFMGDRPDQWIEMFLRDLGFKEINMIGTFSTGLTDVERFVFVAKK